jgi:hypothetical protein
MPTRLIRWTPRTFAAGWDLPPDDIVWIDVMKFDRAWRSDSLYIAPGGHTGQGSRYARVGHWFAEHDDCEMCFATLDNGGVTFGDGRHRFAWLRDHGVASLPMQVSSGAGETFASAFGASEQHSVLADPKRSADTKSGGAR